MSAAVESWVQNAASRRGVLACGVRLSEKWFLIRTNRSELSQVRIEQAMKKLFEASQIVQQNELPAERLRWTFESGQIVCAVRGGGVIAALFINKDIANAGEIEKVLGSLKTE